MTLFVAGIMTIQKPSTSVLARGFVDAFSENTFRGWIDGNTGSADDPRKLLAFRGEELIGECFATIMRGDGLLGFSLEASVLVTDWDILDKSIEILAVSDDTAVIVPFYTLFMNQLAERFSAALNARLASMGISLQSKVGSVTNPTNKEQPVARIKEDLSPIMLPVGTICDDQSAIVGRSGYLYIYRGSNEVLNGYGSSKSDKTVKIVADWAALLTRRRALCTSCSAEFLQLVTPEKSSILPQHFPVAINPPTDLLKTLEAHPEVRDVNSYLSVFALLHGCVSPQSTFLKTDSHFSTYGSSVVMKGILEHICTEFDLIPKEKLSFVFRWFDFGENYEIRAGDLGFRFIGRKCFEVDYLPIEWEEMQNTLSSSRLIHSSTPKGERTSGTKMGWLNGMAPIPLKVLCFGNSFFERGVAPNGLSWWGRLLFEEFHFHWDGATNIHDIEQIKPDLVICQTTERFIWRVPNT